MVHGIQLSVRHVHHMACMRKLHSIQFGSRIRNSFAQRASQNTCQNAQRQTCFYPHKSRVQRPISTDYITCLHLSQVFTFSDWFIYFDCIELVDVCSNKISSHIWIERCLEMTRLRIWRRVVGVCNTSYFFLASFIIWFYGLRYFHIFPAGWWSGGTCSEKQARSTGCFFVSINLFIPATWNGIDRSELDRCTATLKACKNIRSKFHASAKPRSTAGIAERKRVMGPKSWSICCIQTMFHASALSPHPFPVGSNPRSTRLSWYKNIYRGMH